jgi:hypothetical protein
MPTTTYTSGTGNFTAPGSVSVVYVECWGGMESKLLRALTR